MCFYVGRYTSFKNVSRAKISKNKATINSVTMSSLKLNVQKSPKNKNTTTAHTKRADAVHNPIERLINVILRHMFFNSYHHRLLLPTNRIRYCE